MDERADILAFMRELARDVGKVFKKYWKTPFSVRDKGVGDLVTEADIAAEKLCIERITKAFPQTNILSEEAGKVGDKAGDVPLWIIDPIDGTTNYTHGYPQVCIAMGYYSQGKTQVGVVYNPILNEEFYGTLGGGAFGPEGRLQVSQTKDVAASLFATGFGYDRRTTTQTNYPQFCRIVHQSHGVRRSGSAAIDLCSVAAGRLDGYWERGLKPWDAAAGVLFVQEAGGKVTNYKDDGSSLDLFGGEFVATNGKVHQELLNYIQNPECDVRLL